MTIVIDLSILLWLSTDEYRVDTGFDCLLPPQLTGVENTVTGIGTMHSDSHALSGYRANYLTLALKYGKTATKIR